MKVPSTGAHPNFSKFSSPKNYEKSIFLVPVTIVELFASHVPRRLQILSSGDGLESHFQAVFLNLSTSFQEFFFIIWGCQLSISGSRPSQKPSWLANVLTISGDEFPQASGT